jgi:hypothetical protein
LRLSLLVDTDLNLQQVVGTYMASHALLDNSRAAHPQST